MYAREHRVLLRHYLEQGLSTEAQCNTSARRNSGRRLSLRL